MKRIAIILIVIAIILIVLGTIQQIISNKCETIDKNTDFWVRNCDYK